jgi:hypothetical protein
MWVLLRLIFFAMVMALCLPVAGCAGRNGDQGNGTGGPADQREDEGGRGLPGAPDGGDNDKKAPGAPIDIPEITISQGRPLAEVRAELEKQLRERCGGSLCVKLTVESRDDGFMTCQFVTTDPPPKTRVPRDSVVVIVTGTKPCVETPDGNGEGSPASPDGEASPDTEESPNGETSPDGETSSEGETSPG